MSIKRNEWNHKWDWDSDNFGVSVHVCIDTIIVGNVGGIWGRLVNHANFNLVMNKKNYFQNRLANDF